MHRRSNRNTAPGSPLVTTQSPSPSPQQQTKRKRSDARADNSKLPKVPTDRELIDAFAGKTPALHKDTLKAETCVVGLADKVLEKVPEPTDQQRATSMLYPFMAILMWYIRRLDNFKSNQNEQNNIMELIRFVLENIFSWNDDDVQQQLLDTMNTICNKVQKTLLSNMKKILFAGLKDAEDPVDVCAMRYKEVVELMKVSLREARIPEPEIKALNFELSRQAQEGSNLNQTFDDEFMFNTILAQAEADTTEVSHAAEAVTIEVSCAAEHNLELQMAVDVDAIQPSGNMAVDVNAMQANTDKNMWDIPHEQEQEPGQNKEAAAAEDNILGPIQEPVPAKAARSKPKKGNNKGKANPKKTPANGRKYWCSFRTLMNSEVICKYQGEAPEQGVAKQIAKKWLDNTDFVTQDPKTKAFSFTLKAKICMFQWHAAVHIRTQFPEEEDQKIFVKSLSPLATIQDGVATLSFADHSVWAGYMLQFINVGCSEAYLNMKETVASLPECRKPHLFIDPEVKTQLQKMLKMAEIAQEYNESAINTRTIIQEKSGSTQETPDNMPKGNSSILFAMVVVVFEGTMAWGDFIESLMGIISSVKLERDTFEGSGFLPTASPDEVIEFLREHRDLCLRIHRLGNTDFKGWLCYMLTCVREYHARYLLLPHLQTEHMTTLCTACLWASQITCAEATRNSVKICEAMPGGPFGTGADLIDWGLRTVYKSPTDEQCFLVRTPQFTTGVRVYPQSEQMQWWKHLAQVPEAKEPKLQAEEVPAKRHKPRARNPRKSKPQEPEEDVPALEYTSVELLTSLPSWQPPQPMQQYPLMPMLQYPSQPMLQSMPMQQYPSQPMQQYPSQQMQGQPMQGQSMQQHPSQPMQGQPMQGQSMQQHPSQPMQQYPSQQMQGQPMQQHPSQPMQQYPSQPMQQYPSQPMQQYPSQPMQGHPMQQYPSVQGQQPLQQSPQQSLHQSPQQQYQQSMPMQPQQYQQSMQGQQPLHQSPYTTCTTNSGEAHLVD